MKCKRQPPENKYPYLAESEIKVQHLWEVPLSYELVARMRKVAKDHKRTMSWIARYCIFKFLHQLRTKPRYDLAEWIDKAKEHRPYKRNGHRHVVCLFGSDVVLLRTVAFSMNMPLAALFRVAIVKFLETLENGHAVGRKLFRLGTKIFGKGILIPSSWNGIPDHVNWNLSQFPIHVWWPPAEPAAESG